MLSDSAIRVFQSLRQNHAEESKKHYGITFIKHLPLTFLFYFLFSSHSHFLEFYLLYLTANHATGKLISSEVYCLLSSASLLHHHIAVVNPTPILTYGFIKWDFNGYYVCSLLYTVIVFVQDTIYIPPSTNYNLRVWLMLWNL